MSNELQKANLENTNISTIDELISGLKTASVTYYVDENYHMHKIVTLIEEKDFHIIENVQGAISRYLGKRQDVCVSKSFLYGVTGKNVKKYAGQFFSLIYRTLRGFVKDEFTHDLRNIYERG